MLTVAIPFLDFALAAWVVYLRFRLSLREGFLVAAVLGAAWLVAGTELLSLFHAIRFGPVLAWWLLPVPLLAFLTVRFRHRRRPLPAWPRLNVYDYFLLAMIVFILGWSECQAVFSPPNNADSQEYHLQRQVFWMQQAGVQHFSTSNLRQVAMPPLTEFAGLHLMVLTGGDRFHNLVQWFAFLLTLFAVSLMTKRFAGTMANGSRVRSPHRTTDGTAASTSLSAVADGGEGRGEVALSSQLKSPHLDPLPVLAGRGNCFRLNGSSTMQLLAALWVATIPLAFLQASNTKNDVVVMLWLCLLAYWILLLDTRSRLRLTHIALIGLAFGALALTKGTGLIFGLPLGALTAFYLFRRQPRLAVPALMIVGTAALLLNAGHFVRNYRAFGSIAPDSPGIHSSTSLGNEDHSMSALVSNMARTAGSHFVTPNANWNTNLTTFMRSFHDKLGRDIDDPHTTWMPFGRFRPYQFSQDDEDKAAAPAHMLLLLLLPFVLLIGGRQVPWRAIVPLLLVFLAGFILFSFLLKWQNWHVRLVIPLPALIAPVFAWGYGIGRLRFVSPLAALFLAATLVPSLNCMQRPLWGPHSIFSSDPLALRCIYHFDNWPQQYRDLANRLEETHPQTVAFWTDQLPAMAPDYPMQRLLLDQLSVKPTFMSFNSSFQVPDKPEPDPDVVLVARSKQKRVQHTSTGSWYAAGQTFGRYTLFWKQNSEPPPDR